MLRTGSAATCVAAIMAFTTPAIAADEGSKETETFIGGSVGYHDVKTGIFEGDGAIFGVVAGIDTPISDGVFVGLEGNFHLGTSAIKHEYGAAVRAGVRLGGGTKLYVKGGYQQSKDDAGGLSCSAPPGAACIAIAPPEVSHGDYLVGVGAEFGLGDGPVSLRLGADTVGFDTTRLTAGVLFKF